MLLGLSTLASAANLGTHGSTWPIAEQDFRLRMAHDAGQVDWTKVNGGVTKRAKGFIDQQPEWDVSPANHDTVRLVGIQQTLNKDITRLTLGADGNMHKQVLFPKGYSFNPLNYIHPKLWFVLFNGTSKMQVAWVEKLAAAHPNRFLFMAVDGTLSDLVKKTGLAIYPANPWLFATAKVQHTPAMVGVTDSHPKRLTVAQFKVPYTLKRAEEVLK